MSISTLFDLIAWTSGAITGTWQRRHDLAAGTPSIFTILKSNGGGRRV